MNKNTNHNIIKNIITYGKPKSVDGEKFTEDDDEIVRRKIMNALRDLKDPMVPIRAYGIDQLTKIVIVSRIFFIL